MITVSFTTQVIFRLSIYPVVTPKVMFEADINSIAVEGETSWQ